MWVSCCSQSLANELAKLKLQDNMHCSTSERYNLYPLAPSNRVDSIQKEVEIVGRLFFCVCFFSIVAVVPTKKRFFYHPILLQFFQPGLSTNKMSNILIEVLIQQLIDWRYFYCQLKPKSISISPKSQFDLIFLVGAQAKVYKSHKKWGNTWWPVETSHWLS